MCRLFALTTGGPRVHAALWLLDAPVSLAEQSRRMPDGAGLGWFNLGDEPVRDRAPLAAFDNPDFASEARHVVSHTFLAHVRYASTGQVSVRNTHPFDIRDRLFAHNGVVRGLDVLGSWLGPVDKAFVEGQTDSELVFAYITAEIERLGDTTEGIISAVTRIGQELPVYALNFVLAEPGRLWALRYPDVHPLWVLNPELGGRGSLMLDPRTELGRMTVESAEAGGKDVPAFVIASERMDDDPDWRLLEPGELLVVEGLAAKSLFPFDEPAHRLTREDLHPQEASSQAPSHA
ncbi:class II glutamine amidotransferase [Longispora albida]|uniref:class II glutamine amidotransferase n=1 Tax=Longispora albida TaxID=203523 RepID=UPI0003741182|nr:class II glutamine amidotransferase [Longispora albida]